MKHHKRNFKPLGNLIAPLVKRHGQVNINSFVKLLNLWETIVGEDISKKAHPIKMKTNKGGDNNILYLGMTGPFMPELSLQVLDIIEKINSFYSRDVVVEIRLQRLPNINHKNVIELDNSRDLSVTESLQNTDAEFAVTQLENALMKMKTNLKMSRKKNEIKED